MSAFSVINLNVFCFALRQTNSSTMCHCWRKIGDKLLKSLFFSEFKWQIALANPSEMYFFHFSKSTQIPNTYNHKSIESMHSGEPQSTTTNSCETLNSPMPNENHLKSSMWQHSKFHVNFLSPPLQVALFLYRIMKNMIFEHPEASINQTHLNNAM